MSHEDDLEKEVRALLADKLLVDVQSPEDDLLATGALDSLTLVELLLQMEQRFGIQLPLQEMEIGDFSSVRALAHVVAGRTNGRSKAAPAN